MKKLIVILAIFALPSVALAHPGGRDAYGGHYDSSTGKYHVHEGPLEGREYKNQENMIKALKQQKGGPAIIRRAEQGNTQTTKAAPKKKEDEGDWGKVLREVLKEK